MATILVYGANGYTGELVLREAVARGVTVIAAGRSRNTVESVAGRYGFESRVFELNSGEQVAEHLRGVDVVLHCAGPFARTWRPMLDGCLLAKAHYLDVTGELEVFESVKARTLDAASAGVVAMPGVGFDVVPTDCLALHLKKRLPSATHLALGFRTVGGGYSHGTLTTMVENLPKGGAVREGGKLVRVGTGSRVREIDFGRGAVHCAAIPWGDVSTAYTTTGIPNIEVYVPMPRSAALGGRVLGAFPALAGAGPVQRFLKSRVDARPAGPSDKERAEAFTLLWGEARDASGAVVTTRLRTPEGYTLTAATALAIAGRVAAGGVEPGYRTPAGAFGADLVLDFDGVTREDV